MTTMSARDRLRKFSEMVRSVVADEVPDKEEDNGSPSTEKTTTEPSETPDAVPEEEEGTSKSDEEGETDEGGAIDEDSVS